MIYTILHELKPLVGALFPLRLRQLQNMISEHFNSIFWPRQCCTSDDPSIQRFGWSKRRWFEPMCEREDEYLLLFVFRISSKTLDKQIVLYHSELTVPRCSSGTVTTRLILLKKQATICIELLLPRTTFVGFGSSSKNHTVDYCFVSGSYS